MKLRHRGIPGAAATLAVAALSTLAVCGPATSAVTAGVGATGRAAGRLHGGAQTAAVRANGPRVFDDRPNVLMITADDAAPGDLRYMPRTEKLLAQRGVTFTDAVSPDPICVPARASMLTGQYAHNHHALTISGEGGGVQSFNAQRTLPVWLQRAGYQTMFIGKYLNGYGEGGGDPSQIDPGWNQWAATWGGSTYNFTHPVLNINGQPHAYDEYNSRVFLQMTQQLLETPSRSWKPWFMWVNYVAPHQGGPVEPDDPQRLYPNDPSDWVPTTHPARADRGSFAGIQLPQSPSLFRSEPTEPSDGAPMSPTRQAMVRYGYEQRIEALQSVDRAVARTVATLRRTGQLANTVLIFDSDNGFLTGEHNRYGKLVHFNDSERIPLLMAGPGIPKGVKVQSPVALPDLATTIAAIAHARPMRRQDGVNILPVLHERVQDRPIPVEAYPVHGGTQPIYTGIREGPWTYVHWHRHGGFEEMYDRQTDPSEVHNLAVDPAYQAQLRHFRRLDRRYRDCSGPTCPKTFVDPSRQPLLYGR